MSTLFKSYTIKKRLIALEIAWTDEKSLTCQDEPLILALEKTPQILKIKTYLGQWSN